MKREIMEWVISIVVGLLVVIVVTKFIGESYTVSGSSMNHIDNGDVVVFHEDSKRDFIKRVIGTPGDTVEYKGDQLYVNNKKVSEPYLDYNKKHKQGQYLTGSFKSSQIKGSNGEMKLPKDKYLVLGDNRQNSIDSRFDVVGLVDKKQLVGKVVWRYWPFNEWKTNFNPGTF